MTRRQALWLAILVYVTLDLCLPAMPGAFVFEPEGSVETAHRSRGSTIPEVVIPPSPTDEAIVPAPPRLKTATRPAPPRPATRVPTARRPARTVVDVTSSSEDPH